MSTFSPFICHEVMGLDAMILLHFMDKEVEAEGRTLSQVTGL